MDIFEYISQDDILNVKKALEKSPDLIQARDLNGNTPFIYAVFNKKWDIAVYLMYEDGNKIDEYNDKKETALMYACRYGELDLVQILHQNGADLNRESLYIGAVIFYAFESVRRDVLRYLVINGASVNVRNKYGESLLIKAIENDDIAVIPWLINNGAEDIDAALKSAIIYDHLEAVKVLIENGADMNAINANNESLIVDAIRNRHWDIVELLFNKGADIESNTESFGWEILSSAAAAGKLELIKQIIELQKLNRS